MDSTISFFEEASGARNPVNTGVDLIAFDAWGRPERYPLHYDRFHIGTRLEDFDPDIEVEDRLDPAVRVVLKYVDRQLFLSNECAHLRVQVNGQPATYRELFDGDTFQVSSRRFQVLGLKPPLATLEGYTPPHRDQKWVLELGRNPLGRKGQRANLVELDDPTVSRAHASLVVSEYGVTLEAESGSSQSKVNGRRVEVGQPVEVADADLIQLGRQLFRLRFHGNPQGRGRLPTQAVVLLVRLGCSAPLPERARLYLEASRLVLSPRCPGFLLPYDGDAFTFASFAQPSQLGAEVEEFVAFGDALRQAWDESGLERRQLRLTLALHVDSADMQPPTPCFASLRRVLAGAEHLLGLASGPSSRWVLSRAAWALSKKVTTTQRIGLAQVQGQTAPLEAYFVEQIERG